MKLILILLIGLDSQTALALGLYSVQQGTTSDSTTHFRVVAPINEPLQFEVKDSQGKVFSANWIQPITAEGSDDMVYRLKFSNLNFKEKYTLEIKDKKGQVKDRRTFGTLDVHKKAGRMGVTSCMLRALHNPFIWRQFEKEELRPEVFIWTGDGVYLDRVNPLIKKLPETALDIWQEFVRTSNTLEFYFWDHLTPVFSVWDDHDSGGDGVDATFSLMHEAHRIYDVFFANEPIDGFIERGPGLSLNFQLFGQNFIMTDGRSFRGLDPKAPFYGVDLESWIYSKVTPGSNILVNGTQFFGKHLKKDSFEFSYKRNFAAFTQNLRKVGEEKGAIYSFMSGDIHFSEVQVLESSFFGYPTYEITSSSAHSSTLPGRHVFLRNPRRVAATSTHNITNVDFKDSPGMKAHVQSVGWRGQVLFDLDLEVDGVRPYSKKPTLLRASCDSYLQ